MKIQDLQQKQMEVHLHPTQGLNGTWVDADSVYFIKVQALTANDVLSQQRIILVILIMLLEMYMQD